MASCEEPELPVLPDSETAVIAQMKKAKNDVKQYLGDAQVYLECTRSTVRHDAVVDKMKTLGEEFNELVRAYKERVKS